MISNVSGKLKDRLQSWLIDCDHNMKEKNLIKTKEGRKENLISGNDSSVSLSLSLFFLAFFLSLFFPSPFSISWLIHLGQFSYSLTSATNNIHYFQIGRFAGSSDYKIDLS